MEFDWTTFALEALNFLVLLWILKRLFYRPVLAAIDARQSRITAELEQAKQAQQEGQSLREQYEQRLAAWEQERQRLRQQLDEELAQQRIAGAERIRQELLDESTKARARADAAAAVRDAELRRQALDSAYAAAAAMLQRLASPNLTQAIVGMLMDDLAALPPERLQSLRDAARAMEAGSRVQIQSAHPLDAPTLQRLQAALSQAAGCALAPVEADIAPGLIAGVRVAVGQCLLHANLADELAAFRREDEAA